MLIMATELVTFKMEHKFLQEVDKTSKEAGFQSRTEFIRNALREKVEEAKLKKAMMEIAHLKGASKKKTTDEELHRAREKLSEQLSEHPEKFFRL